MKQIKQGTGAEERGLGGGEERIRVITVRLPESDYHRVQEAAHIARMSMNAWCVQWLTTMANSTIADARDRTREKFVPPFITTNQKGDRHGDHPKETDQKESSNQEETGF